MSWFSELAGKAEYVLNNLDERTGNALRARSKQDVYYAQPQAWVPRSSPTNQIPLNKVKSPKKVRKGFDKQKGDEIIHDRATVRRKSLPNSKEMEQFSARPTKLESLSNENKMLRTEIIVCNREIEELIDKLNTLEKDVNDANTKNANLDQLYQTVKAEKETILAELANMRHKSPSEPEFGPEYADLSSAYRALQKDFANANDRNAQLQSQLRDIELSKTTNSSIQMKLENELRFAQTTISDLRGELEKMRNECERIQSDWNAYKLRVKNMLVSKDKEIEALQMNPQHSEGTKMLAQQVDSLREERDQIAGALTSAQDACAEAGARIDQAEARAHAAEKLVCALRETLREERKAKSKAEAQYTNINKAYKTLQMETSQQLATLKAAVHERDAELNKLRSNVNHSATSVCPALDTSALNVADCDKRYESMSNEKIQILTQSLIAKQGRIDVLLAENNNLKLNIETLETTHKRELDKLRSNQRIIQVTDGDAVLRTKVGNIDYKATSALSRLSLRIGVTMRRYPLFRILIMLYMTVLHIWVLIVLLTYSPEVH